MKTKIIAFLIASASLLLNSCNIPLTFDTVRDGQRIRFSSDAKGGLHFGVESAK